MTNTGDCCKHTNSIDYCATCGMVLIKELTSNWANKYVNMTLENEIDYKLILKHTRLLLDLNLIKHKDKIVKLLENFSKIKCKKKAALIIAYKMYRQIRHKHTSDIRPLTPLIEKHTNLDEIIWALAELKTYLGAKKRIILTKLFKSMYNLEITMIKYEGNDARKSLVIKKQKPTLHEMLLELMPK